MFIYTDNNLGHQFSAIAELIERAHLGGTGVGNERYVLTKFSGVILCIYSDDDGSAGADEDDDAVDDEPQSVHSTPNTAGVTTSSANRNGTAVCSVR